MYASSFQTDHSDHSSVTFDALLKHTLCSFVRSQILFVAIRLNLFTIIDESPTRSLSYDELRARRVSLSMLSYLVYLRLLKRCADSPRYECTPVTRAYLVSSRPNYVGLGIGVWDHRRLYTFVLRLNDTLRHGIRTSEDSSTQTSLWSVFEHQHDPMIYFARIMSSFTRCTINELCDRVDFSPYSTLLDVGGSLGDLSRMVVRRYPHVNAFSFDLPELTSYASSLATSPSGVQYVAGDFFDDAWPTEILQNASAIDLVTLKYILHDWSYKQREFLVEKIYKLLKVRNEAAGKNGTLIIIEKMIDEHRENGTSLATSISMAVECGDGVGYDATVNEYEHLVKQAGFQRLESVQLAGPMVALFAHLA